jgi:hypothetical protein
MSDFTIIELTPETIGDYGVCGYKDVAKHVELRKKSTGTVNTMKEASE